MDKSFKLLLKFLQKYANDWLVSVKSLEESCLIRVSDLSAFTRVNIKKVWGLRRKWKFPSFWLWTRGFLKNSWNKKMTDSSYHHLYYSAHVDPAEELEKLNSSTSQNGTSFETKPEWWEIYIFLSSLCERGLIFPPTPGWYILDWNL